MSESDSDSERPQSQTEHGVHVRLEPDKPEDAKVDVVLVHGLNGHALRTFTHLKKNKCWANDKDFWPPDLRNRVRVMTFGYNANIFKDLCTSRIIDHARTLLNELELERTKCKTRPLIFIGHSLGGLVIKKTLMLSHTRNDNSTIASTQAVIFMGTPHMGSDLAKWAGLARRFSALFRLDSSSTNLTEEIESFSATTMALLEEFKDQATKLKIITYYEDQITKRCRSLVVDRHSAILHHPNENTMVWHVKHQDLCRFESPMDQRCRRFMKQLEALFDEAINKSYSEPSSSTSATNIVPHPIPSNSRTDSSRTRSNLPADRFPKSGEFSESSGEMSVERTEMERTPPATRPRPSHMVHGYTSTSYPPHIEIDESCPDNPRDGYQYGSSPGIQPSSGNVLLHRALDYSAGAAIGTFAAMAFSASRMSKSHNNAAPVFPSHPDDHKGYSADDPSSAVNGSNFNLTSIYGQKYICDSCGDATYIERDGVVLGPGDGNQNKIQCLRCYRHSVLLITGPFSDAYNKAISNENKTGEIICPGCDKSYVRLPEYIRCVWRHLKPYICLVCEKSSAPGNYRYSRFDDCAIHIRRQHLSAAGKLQMAQARLGPYYRVMGARELERESALFFKRLSRGPNDGQ